MKGEDGTIFLVDDDASVRDSLALLLSLSGLRTQTFADGESFLTSYRDDLVGCILTDLRMPGMSGLELQRRLTASHCEIPVIFITAHGDGSARSQALKDGAVDYLLKPFGEASLLSAIHAALNW